MPLQDEERLFIEAIRDLNYQASQLQSQERHGQDVAASAALASLENGNNKNSGSDVLALNAANGSEGKTLTVENEVMDNEPTVDVHQDKKRKTSFNPYHGPSFITAIPDNNEPYISSMCIIDPSDRLDSATSLVIDAAMRLNHSNSAPLHTIVSWAVNSPSKTKIVHRSHINAINVSNGRQPSGPPSANNSAHNTPRLTGAKTFATSTAPPPLSTVK